MNRTAEQIKHKKEMLALIDCNMLDKRLNKQQEMPQLEVYFVSSFRGECQEKIRGRKSAFGGY